MTKHDFLGICMECEVNPNLVVEDPEVVDLLKRDKGNPRIENQLLLTQSSTKTFDMNSYENFKRDLAVRILRKIDGHTDLITRIGFVMDALDEALPSDDSVNRGHTDLVDLACVYKVDECPNCEKKDVEYSDVYEFCNECGYTFN